jgi:hypothetical protein
MPHSASDKQIGIASLGAGEQRLHDLHIRRSQGSKHPRQQFVGGVRAFARHQPRRCHDGGSSRLHVDTQRADELLTAKSSPKRRHARLGSLPTGVRGGE